METSTSNRKGGFEFDLHRVTPIRRGGRRDKFVTSISVGRVFELLESEKIWVDYDYQRGVKVTFGKRRVRKTNPPGGYG